MKFRPCIDIHDGKVKQIVGGSLKDDRNQTVENFVSVKDAEYYASLYKQYHLKGGHIIMLNHDQSKYYEKTRKQALNALLAYPGGLQVGGGINDENAGEFLKAGASHVIITSFVFKQGVIIMENLNKLVRRIGKDKVVLDLSCRKKDGDYYIVTDRWQKYTEEKLSFDTLERLSGYCDEFLVHAVDVEGKAEGIEKEVAALLGGFEGIPVTYAGGVHSFEDLMDLKTLGRGKVDVTIGSALDLFGGNMKFEEVLDYMREDI